MACMLKLIKMDFELNYAKWYEIVTKNSETDKWLGAIPGQHGAGFKMHAALEYRPAWFFFCILTALRLWCAIFADTHCQHEFRARFLIWRTGTTEHDYSRLFRISRNTAHPSLSRKCSNGIRANVIPEMWIYLPIVQIVTKNSSTVLIHFHTRQSKNVKTNCLESPIDRRWCTILYSLKHTHCAFAIKTKRQKRKTKKKNGKKKGK